MSNVLRAVSGVVMQVGEASASLSSFMPLQYLSPFAIFNSILCGDETHSLVFACTLSGFGGWSVL